MTQGISKDPAAGFNAILRLFFGSVTRPAL
jgi:hypothetical protein